jgi:hypothetical protein
MEMTLKLIASYDVTPCMFCEPFYNELSKVKKKAVEAYGVVRC